MPCARPDRSLNQRRLEVDISFAGLGVLLFPGALVIAGADPGPCSQALGVAEHGHVDTDLRDDRYRDPVVDAGNLPEQAPLRLVGLSLLRDALVQITQICLDRLDPSQMEGQQVAVMLAEPAVERQSGSSLRRKLRFARSAISCGVAVFSTNAFIIARPDTPNTSLTTLANLMLAVSSSLSVRFCSLVSASDKERRSRTRSRSSRIGGGGTKLGLIRPWRTRSAVHSASFTSVLRPCTLRMWWALATISSKCPYRIAWTGFQ